MRQQRDPFFILNATRVGDLLDRYIEILNSWKGDIGNVPADATAIFAENSPKDSLTKLNLRIYQKQI